MKLMMQNFFLKLNPQNTCIFFLLSPVLTESLQSQYQCLKNEVQACNDFQWNKLRWLKKNGRVLEIEYLIFVYHL